MTKKERDHRYKTSKKGKITRRRYDQSSKGRFLRRVRDLTKQREELFIKLENVQKEINECLMNMNW